MGVSVAASTVAVLFGGLMIGLAGCEDRAGQARSRSTPPPVPVAEATEPDGISISELRRALGANDNAQFVRDGSGISQIDLHDSDVTQLDPLRGLPLTALGISGLPIRDLSPLTGMPLELLTAENTPVEDLEPLRGLPLRELYLRDTKVRSLDPLREAPLAQLNVIGTAIADISAVRDMPLDTLWIASTQVRDLSPLQGKTLTSLDLENTPVEDLSALATMTSLRRLNIAGSAVTDLTPLKDLRLERLIFTPSQIDRGLDIVRKMPSLQTLGTSFDTTRPAAEFWNEFDANAEPDSAPSP